VNLRSEDQMAYYRRRAYVPRRRQRGGYMVQYNQRRYNPGRRYNRPRYRRSYRRNTGGGGSAQEAAAQVQVAAQNLPQCPFVYSQIDPFDVRVLGVKVPDANTMPSETTALNDDFSNTMVLANQVNAWGYNPHISSAMVAANEGAGAWTWTAAYGGGTNCALRSNVISSYNAIRPVAHGIRITCTQPALSAQGFCHVCIFPANTYAKSTWAFPTSVSQMKSLRGYRKVTLSALTQNALTVVNRYTSQDAFQYFGSNEIQAGFLSTDGGKNQIGGGHNWGTIIVALEGVPASAGVSVENLLHLECLPDFSATNSASPPAPSNPQQMAAATHIASTGDPSHFPSEQQQVVNDAAASIAGTGVNAALGAFTPRAQAAAQMLGTAAGYTAGNALISGALGATAYAMGQIRRGGGDINIAGQQRIAV